MHQLGGPADTGIEAVARVKAAIVIEQRRFRLVEVANIMFGRVLRTARVQQFPHTMLAIAIISLPVRAGDKRRQSALFFNGLLVPSCRFTAVFMANAVKRKIRSADREQ